MFGKVGRRRRPLRRAAARGGTALRGASCASCASTCCTRPFGNSHPRFFALHQRHRRSRGHRGRLPGLGHEPELLGRRPRGDPRGAPGRALAGRRSSAFPDTAEGILDLRRLDGELHGARRGAARGAPGTVREDGIGGDAAGSSSTPPTRSTTAWTRRWTSSAWGPASSARSRPTTRFRMRVDLLREAIAEDRRAGLAPAIVVGNAGTVNTGAIDPARRARRPLRARVALVPRRRRLRGDGRAVAARSGRSSPASSGPTPSPPIPTSGSTSPTRRAPPSCASPAGWPTRSASPRSTSSRTRRARSTARPLQRARPRAVARLQGAQGLDGPEAPRTPGLRAQHRARRGPRPLPGRGGATAARTSSCWPSPSSRSSTSAIGRRRAARRRRARLPEPPDRQRGSWAAAASSSPRPSSRGTSRCGCAIVELPHDRGRPPGACSTRPSARAVRSLGGTSR